jgi:hypothetical protein
MKSTQRLVVLFGAGTSLPAGMPTTDSITKTILAENSEVWGRGVQCKVNRDILNHLNTKDELLPSVLRFIQSLRKVVDCFWFSKLGSLTNYEDIYYLAKQIDECESGEWINPGLDPLMNKLKDELFDDKGVRLYKDGDEGQLEMLCEESTKFIADIVWSLIDKPYLRIDHLAFLNDAVADSSISGIDLFTLNYDMVIEHFLESRSILYTDGFDVEIDGLRPWKGSLYDNLTVPVRLFKLHGSVNWFRILTYEPHRKYQRYGIPVNWTTPFQHRFGDKAVHEIPDSRPMLLCGTNNKMYRYHTGTFMELHTRFYQSLEDANCVLVCGYSFGDKGVNTRLLEWAAEQADRCILIAHPEPKRLLDSARDNNAGRIFDLWKKGQLDFIPAKIEELKWVNVKRMLMWRSKL